MGAVLPLNFSKMGVWFLVADFFYFWTKIFWQEDNITDIFWQFSDSPKLGGGIVPLASMVDSARLQTNSHFTSTTPTRLNSTQLNCSVRLAKRVVCAQQRDVTILMTSLHCRPQSLQLSWVELRRRCALAITSVRTVWVCVSLHNRSL